MNLKINCFFFNLFAGYLTCASGFDLIIYCFIPRLTVTCNEFNFSAFLYRIASDYERHANLALGNTEYYLANPVNAFLLVKRFTLDWGKLDTLLSTQTNTGKSSIMVFFVSCVNELKKFIDESTVG